MEALILTAGEDHLAEVGFARFSAREVAKRVGYSIGTIYNVFGRHDRLILAINARTLRAWTTSLGAAMAEPGADRIAALVHGYFDFAEANRNRWMALYDHRMGADEVLPDDFTTAFHALLGIIAVEVAATRSRNAADDEVAALTGSLVAIAHGHCLFALNGTHLLFGNWQPRAAALAAIRAALLIGEQAIPAHDTVAFTA